MGHKSFSIITPVYGSGAARLGQTIRSVLAQDPDLYEYIIVDGGSTDDTLSALDGHRDRLALISGPDRGVYDAMNKGIAASSGKYLYFLGAGDCLRRGILGPVRACLPAGELNFVYGDTNMMDRDAPRYDGAFDCSKLRRMNICHQSIFYQRALFDALGKFDLRYPILADYEFNLRCFGSSLVRAVYIDQVISDFEGGGVSSRQPDQRFLRDYWRLVWRHLGGRQYVRLEIDRLRELFTLAHPATGGRLGLTGHLTQTQRDFLLGQLSAEAGGEIHQLAPLDYLRRRLTRLSEMRRRHDG